MRLELLANTREDLKQADTPAYATWSWRDWAAHARGEIEGQGEAALQSLTALRRKFLETHAIDNRSPNPKSIQGPTKTLACKRKVFEDAGLDGPLVDVEALTPGSAWLRLSFHLLTPLLTRDDDPFYLFDNPVRKDRIFGLPHLAAASVKGLALDAFRRGFPAEVAGENHPERDRAYRLRQKAAKRLFGIAADGETKDIRNERGRVHWGPVWFEKVQYLVMNPMNPEKGTGTQPIQFEAIAPGQEADVQCFYFNPCGHDPATALEDLAALIGALAVWWPVLGLGAKRRAGYGALKPCRAEVQIYGQSHRCFKGGEAWMAAARYLEEQACSTSKRAI